MSRLSNKDREHFRTGAHPKLLEGPVSVSGRYVVWYKGKIVKDDNKKWLTFDTMTEAQKFYEELKNR